MMWRSVTGGVRARLAVLGAAGALVMSTTGCSLLSGGSGGSGDPGSAGKPKIEIGADGHVKGAIATATTPYQGYKIQVDIVSLTRYDKVTRLVFVVKPVAGAASQDSLDGQAFGSKDDIHGDVSGVSLIDTKNLKEYDTLTVGSETCACSYADDYTLDQPTTLYADYPAVPDSVDELTVLLPKVGPIPNVAVSS